MEALVGLILLLVLAGFVFLSRTLVELLFTGFAIVSAPFTGIRPYAQDSETETIGFNTIRDLAPKSWAALMAQRVKWYFSEENDNSPVYLMGIAAMAILLGVVVVIDWVSSAIKMGDSLLFGGMPKS